MFIRLKTLALGTTVIIAVLLVRKLLRSLQLRRLARRHGCQPVRHYRHSEPLLGTDLFELETRAIHDGDLIGHHMRCFAEYGKTYSCRYWGARKLHSMDWRVNRALTGALLGNFGVEHMRYPATMPLLGRNIMTTDGAEWERYRDAVRPVFARAQIQNLLPFARHFDDFLDSLPADASTVDLQERFKVMMENDTERFIFGDRALADSGDGEGGKSESVRLNEAFDSAMRHAKKRWLLGRLRVLLGLQSKYKRDCAEVHAIVDGWIEAAFRDHRAKRKSDVETEDPGHQVVLLDKLIEAGYGPRAIRDQLLGVFFPARDTPAVVMGNIFWYVARRPSAWEKMRNEALAIDQPLTFELLKKLRYIHWVINETLRLVVPAPTSFVISNRDTVLPEGGGPSGDDPLLVPRGTYVMFNWRALHRDEDVWGPDARSFRPERWGELVERQPLQGEFVPFNAGRRMCPGQQMALAKIAFVLVQMARRFERVEKRDPVDEYVEGYQFTMENKNGVQVGLVPAGQDKI